MKKAQLKIEFLESFIDKNNKSHLEFFKRIQENQRNLLRLSEELISELEGKK